MSSINSLKESYDSLRREVMYNLLIDFSIPVKLERPTGIVSK